MQDHLSTLIVAGSALLALVILSRTALAAWREWLGVQQMALQMPGRQEATPAARIELADLRERIRKLEAIASGVDLLP